MTRWRALLGVLGLTLVGTYGYFARQHPELAGIVGPARARDGRGRFGREGAPSTSGCSQSIDCAVAAGDKTGNWYALTASGSMLSGSSLTMSATGGTPGVSPLSFPGTGAHYDSANVTFPAGDFSVVTVVFLNDRTQYAIFVSKWDGVVNTFTLRADQTTGVCSFALNGGGTVFKSSSAAVALSQWVAVGLTYTASTGAVKIRLAGTNTTQSFGATTPAASTYPHEVGTQTKGNFTSAVWKSRGVFFTEKILSDADIDRIATGAL